MLDVNEKRKIRIMERARRYAEGYISLQDFFDDEVKENDDIREQERQKMKKLLEEAHRERLRREGKVPKTDPPVIKMTKEEFNKLPLWEQSKLYEEHPREIRKITGHEIGSKMTKEQFDILTHKEQEKLFIERRDEIFDLLGGNIAYVDMTGDTI